MRLSGVDPGIIRELSGIYKPFIKAFKELVSNAYDADANRIVVELDADYGWLEVRDDGCGMTPYQFHRDFARLGGSTAWLRGGKSPGGRERIGYKGIGFLAVARYCSSLRVESRASRPFRAVTVLRRGNRKSQPLADIVGDVVDFDLVSEKIRVTKVTALTPGGDLSLRKGTDWEQDDGRVRLLSKRSVAAREHRFSYEVNCRQMVLEATLDFDYLLSLEHRADLGELDDFCTLTYRSPSDKDPATFTRVRLDGLKDFVVRDLSAPPVKGKARNIIFKSGQDRFLWELSRSAPIHDDYPEKISSNHLRRFRDAQAEEDLPQLIAMWRSEESRKLLRPVYMPNKDTQPIAETLTAVDINQDGLVVTGYIMARSEVIYPAEFRGIAVRVRNVMIGNAGYFGWENILSGPRKAALGQITGELRVIEGLDAADAINPGRESFYEEATHYRLLRQTLCGSGDTIGGLIGKAVKDILDRIHVRSQVKDVITSARVRRKALGDIAAAVSFFARRGTNEAKNLASFFGSGANGCQLEEARNLEVKPGHKLGGFELVVVKGLGAEYKIDYQSRRVRLDYHQDAWDTTVFLHGHYYEVRFKIGKPGQPICEFDHGHRRIYVNWGHPVKQNMDDEGFLKSAILLPLAYYAAPKDADAMMNLALNMMAFRTE